MQSVLVTGGAGYVGSHTCKALSKAGLTPICLDDLSGGHRSAVRWGPLVEMSVGDQEALAQVLRQHSVTAVIHFAGFIEAGLSMTEPARFYHNNVSNSLRLLDAVRLAGVKHFVFSSSAAVYGTPISTPIHETHPLHPINVYGETKLVIENALRWYHQAYGLRFAALRYFNAAGADPDGELGECHDPETHLIPLMIRACMDPSSKLKVFGDDYPTRDGTAIRDYVHVSDLADAHVSALHRLSSGGDSLVANLGSGNGTSIKELLEACRQNLGIEPHHEMMPRRPGDPPILIADATLAKDSLGWIPKRSTIDTIVSSAHAWHMSRKSAGA